MVANAVVGYYDASRQAGNQSQVGSINLAGLTPVSLENFNAQEFENVDIILTQNPFFMIKIMLHMNLLCSIHILLKKRY